MLTETQRKQWDTLCKGLNTTADHVYNIQGDVSSLLLEKLIAEKIPYININGNLLIHKKDWKNVAGLNKEILQDLSNTGLETNFEDLSSMIRSTPQNQTAFISIENLGIHDVMDLMKNSKDIPSLIFCSDKREADSYTVTVQKDMISTRNSKSFGQAYLETVLNNQITDPVTRVKEHKYEQNVQGYVQANPISKEEYFMVSGVDPSTFICVGKDGFSVNQWQVEGKDLIRNTIKKVGMENENYLTMLYKEMSLLPDIKVLDTKGELSNFLMGKGKNMRKNTTLATIRMKRGVKKLAKIVNAMVLLKDPNKTMSFGDYNAEVAKIMNALHQGIVPDGYDAKNIDKLKKVIDSYGINMINFERVSNYMEQVPKYCDTLITPDIGISGQMQGVARE